MEATRVAMHNDSGHIVVHAGSIYCFVNGCHPPSAVDISGGIAVSVGRSAIPERIAFRMIVGMP